MMRTILFGLVLLTTSGGASAEIIDRIAAIIDDEAITTSEIEQFVLIRFYDREADESDEEYRRRILTNMIAQTIRYRDVIRFGAIEVTNEDVESRIDEIRARFESPQSFEEALAYAEVSMEQLRAIVKRQIQVETYIDERFSPMIFVSLEEIEKYYRDVWVEQRLESGREILPLAAVREEIRERLKSAQLQDEIERWTRELRERASVDVYL